MSIKIRMGVTIGIFLPVMVQFLKKAVNSSKIPGAPKFLLYQPPMPDGTGALQ
ncbi:MAG: hypothetical protein RQ741_00765 [Wenzhouxiangellaceae bacterium]|nr:hypothetical protein [Wenzhouxiangellaceae bacterium]